MSKKTSNKETMAGLFKTEAAEWLEAVPDGKEHQWLSYDKQTGHPKLPKVASASEKEMRAYWRTLRSFFRSGKGGDLPAGKEDFQPYPALLSPFRNSTFTQRDYPCWINDAEAKGPLFFSLPEFLQGQVNKMAPEEGQARVLKDNLLRLESIIRNKLSLVDEAFKAQPVLVEALKELETQLSIPGEEGKTFSSDLERLRRQLPSEGVFVPFSPNASMHMLFIILQRQIKYARRSIQEQIIQLINQLNDIMVVEREKSPEAQSPEHLHSALDFADDFLNFDELSSLLPSGNSQIMPEERHERIEKVLETLKRADELLFSHQAFIVCAENGRVASEIDWRHSFPTFSVQAVGKGQFSQELLKVFDTAMAAAATLFTAIRIGTIEVANEYTAEVHADFFAHFDWQNFDDEELAACAPILLVANAQDILENELDDFSRLLASNRPVKLLIEKVGHSSVSAHDFIFRQELGALAIAHRNTFVLQSAMVKPAYLHKGFTHGLSASAPALFYLLSPLAGKNTASTPDLWSSAAVEGREFPAFIFDSQKGPKWGNRFDIQNNPNPEDNWPKHQLTVQSGEEETMLELVFTFADFAAQDARFKPYFHLVPPSFWSSDLIPLSDYLELHPDELLSKVPYIWMTQENNHLQRAAIAWPLVQICQERLDFWHYLQENAGVHSYHVEQATEQLRRKLESETEEKMKAMQADFEKELEAVKESSARSTMENLASVLLDLDADLILQDQPQRQPTPKTMDDSLKKEEKDEEPLIEEIIEQPAAVKEEMSLSLGEAWIETPLCTSCNECLDINSKIFQYNAEKQAIIANPKGGKFADIVKAAENCPVKIIHPGAPQDPNEAKLEEWVKRATPFQ